MLRTIGLISLTGCIPPSNILHITPATVPAGTVGVAYSVTFTVSAGNPACLQDIPTWSLLQGAVPPGLQFDPQSPIKMQGTQTTLAGTPTAAGTFMFMLQVKSNTSNTFCTNTAIQNYTLTIAPATGRASSTTTLTSSTGGTSAFGQSVTFTATVAPVPPATGTPTGTVTFAVDGTNQQPPAQLTGGIATSSAMTTLSVGTHQISGLYSGDTNFLAGTPTPLTQTVNSASAASKLAFTAPLSNAAAGVPITPAVQVAIQDAFGNTVTSATSPITLAFGTNPSGGTLSGASAPTVSGVATFSNLSIDKAGTGYTLVATSGTLTQATSNSFDISAGAATALAFKVQPSNAAVNANITPAVEVSVVDNFGNIVTSSSFTVNIAIGAHAAGVTLAGTIPQNTFSGVATFNNLSIDTANTGYTLVATTTNPFPLSSATSNPFDISAVTQSIAISSGNPQSTQVNTNFSAPLSVLVTSGGNPVSGAPVTFTVIPAPGGASAAFPGGSSETQTTGSLGVATSNTLTANGTPGTFTVTATVAGAASPATFALTNTCARTPICGNYAFLFSGFEGTSGGLTSNVVIGGSFVVDLSGNVVSGVEDVNRPGGVTLSVPIGGSATSLTPTSTSCS